MPAVLLRDRVVDEQQPRIQPLLAEEQMLLRADRDRELKRAKLTQPAERPLRILRPRLSTCLCACGALLGEQDDPAARCGVLRDLAHGDLVDVAALDAVRQIDREQTGVSGGAARDRNERDAAD